jgi:hypothetical protein
MKISLFEDFKQLIDNIGTLHNELHAWLGVLHSKLNGGYRYCD